MAFRLASPGRGLSHTLKKSSSTRVVNSRFSTENENENGRPRMDREREYYNNYNDQKSIFWIEKCRNENENAHSRVKTRERRRGQGVPTWVGGDRATRMKFTLTPRGPRSGAMRRCAVHFQISKNEKSRDNQQQTRQGKHKHCVIGDYSCWCYAAGSTARSQLPAQLHRLRSRSSCAARSTAHYAARIHQLRSWIDCALRCADLPATQLD